MRIIEYIKYKLARKKARRITQVYSPVIETFQLKDLGEIQFANWDNPLALPYQLSSDMVDFFKQFIKEGDLVIDIGANIGDTTVPIALCAGKSGLTLGFDPNPYVFRILEANSKLNPDKTNIHPINCAISTTEEEFYFISSEASFSNGGISRTKESKHGKFIQPNKIKGVNLLRFLQEKYPDWVSKLSFIKIDTEGYDKEILKSIGDLISAYKPVIIAESFGKSTNEQKMELYEVIAKHGYDIYYFADFDVHAPVKKINNKEEITYWKKTINIYAIGHK
jgi:FkbM family methyltransferase